MEIDIHAAGSEVDPPCLRQDGRNSSKGHVKLSRVTTVRNTNQDGAFGRSSPSSSQKEQFEWGAKLCFSRNRFLPSLPAINLLSLSSQAQIKKQQGIEKHKSDAFSASSSVDFDPGFSSSTSASVDGPRFVAGRGEDGSKKSSSFPCSGSRGGLSIKAEIELAEKAASVAAAASGSVADFKFIDSVVPETPAYFSLVEESPVSDKGLSFPREPESLKGTGDLCPDSDDLDQCAVKTGYVCLTEEALLNHNDAGEDLTSCGDSDFSEYTVIDKWTCRQAGVENPDVRGISEREQPKRDAPQRTEDSLVDSVQDVGTTQSPPFSSVDPIVTTFPTKVETMTSTCLRDEMPTLSPGTFDETFWLENHLPPKAHHLKSKCSNLSSFLPPFLQNEGSSCDVDEPVHRGRKQQENNSTCHQPQEESTVDALESCYDNGSVVDSSSVILKSQQLIKKKETSSRDIGSQATPESLRKMTVSKIPKLIQRERYSPIDKKSIQTLSPQKSSYDERKSLALSSPGQKASTPIEMTHAVHLPSRHLIQGVTRSDPSIPGPSVTSDAFIVRDRRPVRSGRIPLNPLRRPTTTKTARADKSMSISTNSTESCLQDGPPNNVIRLLPPWNSVAFTANPHLSSKPKVSFAPDAVSNQQPALIKSKLPSFKVKAIQKPVATETNEEVSLQQSRIHPPVRRVMHAQSTCEHESVHQGTDSCKTYAYQRRGSRLPRRTVAEPNLSGTTDAAGFGDVRERKFSTQSTLEAKTKSIMKKDLQCHHENPYDTGNASYPKQGNNASINSTCDMGVNENSNSIQNPETPAENEIMCQDLQNFQMFSGGLKFPKAFKFEPNKVPLDSCEGRQFRKAISRLTTEKSSSSCECSNHAPTLLLVPYVSRSNHADPPFKINSGYKNTQAPSKKMWEDECEFSCTPMANLAFQRCQSDYFQRSAGTVAGFNMPQHQVFLHQQKEKED